MLSSPLEARLTSSIRKTSNGASTHASMSKDKVQPTATVPPERLTPAVVEGDAEYELCSTTETT